MRFKNGFLVIAMMSGLSLACSNTVDGARKDAEINAEKAAAAADKAEDKAAPAAREAAAETKQAAREAGATTTAAIETIDVKSALMADRTVDASHINVDTLKETMTVVLKGSVKSASQRDEAARIAAAEAPGYRINNQLAIVPNP